MIETSHYPVTQVQRRVQRGIEFLEKEVGKNWPNLIDLEYLRLTRPTACVLGQVFHADASGTYALDGFVYAMDTYFDGSTEKVIDHGFDQDKWSTFDELQTEWERVIEEKQKNG